MKTSEEAGSRPRQANRQHGEPGWVRWLLGRAGLWAAAAWGFAEGTLFIVVPDMLFTLTTLLRPRRGLLQLGVVIAGATLAGAAMYSWSAANPAQARRTVAGVPYVGETMIAQVERQLDQRGNVAMFTDPLSGVPYKVYAMLAPARLTLVEFLALSIPLRFERLILSWVPFAMLSLALRRQPEQRRRRWAVGIHAIFWVAVYAYYWSRI